MTVAVCAATGRDLTEVSETRAEAFFADPVSSWWIPEGHRRKEILPAFFGIMGEVTLPGEEVYRSTEGSVPPCGYRPVASPPRRRWPNWRRASAMPPPNTRRRCSSFLP
ncbi:MAG TPA: hypothetical protein VJT72_10480 [Pseudonocardiaceae bacterium]|nr:hypothetical protein [Pseudonocardiaceae bacterium]